MAPGLAKLSFLVVEDNHHMTQIVKTVLKTLGAVHVHEARDVAEAFDVVRRDAIDIILLDYNLGFMDGVEFVRMMRTAPDSPNPYVPIIMLTAHTEPHRIAAARDAGVTEFCAKPIVPLDINRKIVHVVENVRAFVRADGFFGPDRRRHAGRERSGPEARGQATARPVLGAPEA